MYHYLFLCKCDNNKIVCGLSLSQSLAKKEDLGNIKKEMKRVLQN